jgi:hypothetical protein
MNITDLSASQLRRAASIQERIEKLHKELTDTLGTARPTAAPDGRKKKRTISAATRKKMADAHKARWAKIKQASKPTLPPKKKKSTISAAGLANIRAAQKARWAKIKAAQKQ